MRIPETTLLSAIQDRQKALKDNKEGKRLALLIIDEHEKPNDNTTAFTPPESDRRAVQQRLIHFSKTENIPIFAVTMRDSLDRQIHQLPLKIRALFPPDTHLFTKKEESAFHGTRLHQDLQSLKVDTLVIAGFHVNACVAATIGIGFDDEASSSPGAFRPKPAIQRGYRVMTAGDIIHAGWDNPNQEAYWADEPGFEFYERTV